MTVQWYPGHMAKTRRLIKENIKRVDIVIEVRDARIPLSSANPDILDLVGSKPRLILLNKADLADPQVNTAWVNFFNAQDIACIPLTASKGFLPRSIIQQIQSYGLKHVRKSKVTKKPMRAARCMVIGIPNVGKSSFINAISRRRAARTGAKPGLTQGKQLINVTEQLQLLDTPGILWPKFDDMQVGMRLAATGAVSEAGFPLDDIVLFIFNVLVEHKIITGYSTEGLQDYLTELATKRNFLLKGAQLDVDRAKQVIWQEFATGKSGRISLETPEQDI